MPFDFVVPFLLCFQCSLVCTVMKGKDGKDSEGHCVSCFVVVAVAAGSEAPTQLQINTRAQHT